MRELDFEKLDLGLFNSKVSHFNIETMEVDALDALTHILVQSALENFIKLLIVGEGTSLVELKIQRVELRDSVGVNKATPERRACNWANGLILGEDLLEIPRECEDISMFLF